jgi:hypothetical protein
MAGTRRLNVELDTDQHRRVKAGAVQDDVTMSSLARALFTLWEQDPHLRVRARTTALRLEAEARERSAS